jgi:hypothetical protein
MAIVNTALELACRAEIDAQYGPIPSNLQAAEIQSINDYRDKLAKAIAKSGKYVRDNGVVNSTVAPGIHVTTVGSPTTQTGATDAPGSATGTIS